MNKSTKRKIIEDKISQLTGNEFQDFCDRLFLKLYPDDYTPVRAGGPKGDMKNDGYCPKARTFFAAFGTRSAKIADIKSKIKSDLVGCLEKQSDVKKWVFITNDTLVGEVEAFIDELRVTHNPLVIEILGHKKITEEILKLPDEDIEYIIDLTLEDSISTTNINNSFGDMISNTGTGIVQTGDNSNITQNIYQQNANEELQEMTIIDEIFDYALDNLSNHKEYKNKGQLDFREKIKLNFTDKSERLSIIKLFYFAFAKMSILQDKIESLSNDQQNDLSSHIQGYYDEFKMVCNNYEILHNLFKVFTPKNKENNPSYTNLSRAFVLMFFEDCSIFETEEEINFKYNKEFGEE